MIHLRRHPDRSPFTLGLSIAAIALMLIALPACNGNKSKHKERVDAANNRWRAMRSELILQTAQQHFDTGDLDQAQSKLIEAMEIDPQNANLLLLAGRIALEKGQLERAYGRFQSAIDADETLTQAYYLQGIVLQRWQRHTDALDRYRKAYELQPDRVTLLLAVAETLVTLKRTDEALALLKEKQVYFDQSAALRLAVGQIYMMRDDPESAVHYFQQAAVLKPDDAQITESMIMAQVRAGRFDDAIIPLQQLLRKPDYTKRRDLEFLLGQCQLATDHLPEARAIFLRLVRQEQRDATSWLKLGETCWQAGDLAGALRAAERYMHLRPEHHEGYLLAGLVWQHRKRWEQAERLFARAAELSTDSEPVILKGLVMQDKGQLQAARAAYAEALRRDPQDTRAKALLTSVSAQMNSRDTR